MASTPPLRVSKDDRVHAAPASRKQLLTARASLESAPRVVLHLPDLEALSAVAIGPPRPASKRRVDPAHTVVADRSEGPVESKPQRLSSVVKKQLFDLAKAPVGQLVEQVAPNGKLSIPRLVVLLQSPKMLLAGVMAIGLQLAALLAIFTGQPVPDVNVPSAATGTSSQVADAPDVSLPSVPLPAPAPLAGGPGPIHTPLSSPNSFAPSLPGVGSPTIVAQPALPPPQSLSGLKPGDVPPWGDGRNAADVAVPLAAPLPPSPTSPGMGTPLRTAPTVQTSDAATGKSPRVRLQGTIRKASTSETAP